jgi:hypothetical protein
MLSSVIRLNAQERVQEFAWSYPADRFQELTILNRLGNVDVRQGGDLFEIKAEVRIKAKSGEKVDEIMEYLKIDAIERPTILHVSSVLEKNLTFKKLFCGVSVYVDYRVKIPKGKKLSVANKDGSVIIGNFTGDLNVEVVTGDFKARQIEGDFTAKLTDGLFEVQDVNRFTGDFQSATVKIISGSRLKLNSDGSKIDVGKAEEIIAKCAGGTLNVNSVDEINLAAAGAKCEIQDVSESFRGDLRSSRLVVRSINHFFSSVDIAATNTNIALHFRPGGGFNMNLKHDNIKIALPAHFALETKPTMNRKVFIESGFIGDKQFNSQVSLNVTGGKVSID